MKVIRWNDFIKDGFNSAGINLQDKKTSVTVGMFDGIHRGHQELIKKIVSFNKNYLPVIITFRQNYKTGTDESQKEILSFQQKLEMFERMGIQITIAAEFTDDFKKMTGTEFLEILIKHSNVGFFAAGNNFRCGCQLDTNAAAIKEFFSSRGIPTEIIPEVFEGSLPVSSSRIRAAIIDGNISLAQTMLGRKWEN